MYCFDIDESSRIIYGKDETQDGLRRIEMDLMACQNHAEEGKKCNTDKDKLFEYLGPLDFLTIYNIERVDARNFTEPI